MILEQVLANKATWRHLGWYQLVCWWIVPWPSVYVTNWPQLPSGLDCMRHGGSGLVSWQGKVELLNLSLINIQAQISTGQSGSSVEFRAVIWHGCVRLCLRACALSHFYQVTSEWVCQAEMLMCDLHQDFQIWEPHPSLKFLVPTTYLVTAVKLP